MAIQNVTDPFVTPQTPGDTYLGNESDQTYVIHPNFLGAGDVITIIDRGGDNVIELVGGLEIRSSIVTANEVLLTTKNGAQINLRGAATFTFVVGANSFAFPPIAGETQDFVTFATETLGVPADQMPQEGDDPVVITDPVKIVEGGGTVTPVDYILTADVTEVDEGGTVTLTLSNTNLPAGSEVAVAISGITADDVVGGVLPTVFVVGEDGTATLTIELAEDATAEGEEILTATVAGVDPVTVTVNDTSQDLTLTQALDALQAANEAVATAAEDMNAGLEGDDYATPYSADAEGVQEARDDAQAVFDDVEGDLDALLAETAAKNNLTVNGKTAVEKYLGDTAKLTESNLTNVLNEVQDEIDAETAIYSKDGEVSTYGGTFDLNNDTDNDRTTDDSVDQVLNLSRITVAKADDITINLAEFDENNKDGNGGGGRDTIILPNLANYAGVLTIDNMILGDDQDKGFDTLVAPGLDTTFNNVDVTVADDYLTFTLNGSDAGGSVVFNNLIKAETLAEDLVNPENMAALITADNALNFGITLDDGGNVTGVNVEKFASALADALNSDDYSFAALLQGYGNLKSSASTSGLESVGFTLADLQQEMLDAEQALADASTFQSDADLLDNVRVAINAYFGAGGRDVNANDDAGDDLLAMRDAIVDALAAEDDSLEIVDVVSEDLLIALSGVVELTDGEAVFVRSDRPDQGDGQGTWLKGEEVDGEFEWTYQPTSQEQALLDALSDVEARQELAIEVKEATTHFTDAAIANGEQLGAQLLAIEDRLDELADAEQAVDDAQAELDAANALIDGLESALADQADAEMWFDENGYALPINLDDNKSATNDGDIFLFQTSEGDAFSINGFGEAGDDILYFGGDFTLVSLADLGLEITDRVGDNTVMEIFWDQDGADLTLYVEADPAAGFDRDGLATSQMTTVTLVGVSNEDIVFENGSLTLG